MKRVPTAFDEIKDSVQAAGAARYFQRRARGEAEGRNPGDVGKVETLKGAVVRDVEEGAEQTARCRTTICDPVSGHVS